MSAAHATNHRWKGRGISHRKFLRLRSSEWCPCAAAPLTIVTTPNIPPVVAPQRKANHHTMGLEAFIAAFPPNEVKYVKKKSVLPNKPALTHLHNDGLGRVVQEQEWINRSSMRRGHSCLSGFVLVAPKKKGSDAYFSWRPH